MFSHSCSWFWVTMKSTFVNTTNSSRTSWLNFKRVKISSISFCFKFLRNFSCKKSAKSWTQMPSCFSTIEIMRTFSRLFLIKIFIQCLWKWNQQSFPLINRTSMSSIFCKLRQYRTKNKNIYCSWEMLSKFSWKKNRKPLTVLIKCFCKYPLIIWKKTKVLNLKAWNISMTSKDRRKVNGRKFESSCVCTMEFENRQIFMLRMTLNLMQSASNTNRSRRTSFLFGSFPNILHWTIANLGLKLT